MLQGSSDDGPKGLSSKRSLLWLRPGPHLAEPAWLRPSLQGMKKQVPQVIGCSQGRERVICGRQGLMEEAGTVLGLRGFRFELGPEGETELGCVGVVVTAGGGLAVVEGKGESA